MTSRAKQNADQYLLPFEAARNELLAQIALLRGVELVAERVAADGRVELDPLSPGRCEGVVQLLERLALLGNDLTERDGRVVVRAQVAAIAARIKSRSSVAEKTVRNWRRDAEALGVLSTDFVSRKFGRRNWNAYTIQVAKLRDWVAGRVDRAQPAVDRVAGSGRKWAETVTDLGAVTISAPGPVTITAPKTVCQSEETNDNGAVGTAAPSVVVVSSVEVWNETASTEQRLVDAVVSCGLGRAEEAVRRALARGLTEPEVLERVAFWQSSPEAERRPGVLYNWLACRGSYESTVRERSSSRPRSSSSARAAETFARYQRERAEAAVGGLTEEEKQLMRAAGLRVH